MERRTIQRDWPVINPRIRLGERGKGARQEPDAPKPSKGLISSLTRDQHREPTGRSMRNGWVRAALLVCLGLTVASCAATIADNLPVWAGGEPPGIPPRPGTPEYEAYRYRLTHPQAVPTDDSQTGAIRGSRNN
jgi:hypothetical protein